MALQHTHTLAGAQVPYPNVAVHRGGEELQPVNVWVELDQAGMTQRNIVNIRSFFQSQSAAKKHAPQLEAYCTTPDDPLKLWVQYCFTTSQSFMVPSQPPAGHHEVFKSFIEFICSMYPAARIRQFAHCQIIKTNSIHFNNS